MMIVYRCEDSPESIFTAIYNAYEEKRNHKDTCISLTEEYFLFAEYVPVRVEMEKVHKVMNTLQRRFGEADYGRLWQALCSFDTEKGQAVYQTVVAGLGTGSTAGHLFDNLADNFVRKAFELSRAVGNEACHLKGFLRFEELKNGVLLAQIGPKNNIMTFLMPHFADRFPMENFMIHDDKRELYGIHPAGKQWYLVQGEAVESGTANKILRENGRAESVCETREEDRIPGGVCLDRSEWSLSDNELRYQELFRYFCQKIAIKERESKKLQRNLLPLRFREYMTEFQQNTQ